MYVWMASSEGLMMYFGIWWSINMPSLSRWPDFFRMRLQKLLASICLGVYQFVFLCLSDFIFLFVCVGFVLFIVFLFYVHWEKVTKTHWFCFLIRGNHSWGSSPYWNRHTTNVTLYTGQSAGPVPSYRWGWTSSSGEYDCISLCLDVYTFWELFISNNPLTNEL